MLPLKCTVKCKFSLSRVFAFFSRAKIKPPSMAVDLKSIKNDMLSTFQLAVSSVLPHKLVRDTLKVEGRTLYVQSSQYLLKKNCYVVGFGKAVLGMATVVENILGEHLIKGIISVPVGIREILKEFPEMQPMSNTVLEIIEGAKYNIPDDSAEKTAKKIANLAESLKNDDILIVLISGGGSALLPYPRAAISLQDKVGIIRMLTAKGATIQELNCIRKQLSVLKGGGLAKLAYPAQVVSLILSDVVGDPLETIASGPTVINNDGVEKAMNIIKHLGVTLSKSMTNVLTETSYNVDSGAPGDSFEHVRNIIIGNNMIAVTAAEMEASRRGYKTAVLSTKIEMDVCCLGQLLVSLSIEICKYFSNLCSKCELDNILSTLLNKFNLLQVDLKEKILSAVEDSSHAKSVCLIGSGETTVHITGSGIGGRNQHLALSFANYMHEATATNQFLNNYNVVLLSAGTDGIDGPTQAAGAFGYCQQFEAAGLQELPPQKYLQNNDSNTFYSKLNQAEDLIVTGHTGTNVMDIQILTIQRKK